MIALVALLVAAVPASTPSGRVVLPPPDYPAESVKNGEEGDVGYSMTVKPDGTVTGCHVTVPSRYPRLDKATCRWLGQARINPATRAGQPVSEVKTGTVNWTIPRAARAAAARAAAPSP